MKDSPPPAGRSESGPVLKRTLRAPQLMLYGVGTMVGGGFYALLGEVAAHAGMATALAFGIAALVALFSALSFSELSARFPSSAGPAHYAEVVFRSRALALLLGLLIVSTGIVSAATLSRAIGGFLFESTGLPESLGIALVLLLLASLAAWGVSQSVWVAVGITLLEVGGLVLILVLLGEHLGDLPQRWRELVPSDPGAWRGCFLASFLAFYAFVGFEDMVHMAEEVRDPARALPLGILGALALTTVLYITVALTALLAVPVEVLTESRTPLAALLGQESAGARKALFVVSVLAGANGALVQILMASRVVFGLARRHSSDAWLARLHPRTQTPIRATVLASCAVLALALFVPLVPLANATSTTLLVVFLLVNLTLLTLRLREGRSDSAPPLEGPTSRGPRVPLFIPALGVVSCAAFLALRFLG